MYKSKPCPDKFDTGTKPLSEIVLEIILPISLIFNPGFIIETALFKAAREASTKS